MSYRIDPKTGDSVFHASDIPTLAPDERALADSLHAYLLAGKLIDLMERGERYFTLPRIGASHGITLTVQRGAELGLWKEATGGRYWTFTSRSWPWCRTAQAVFNEKHGEPGKE